MLARQFPNRAREIVYRTRGHAHGPITRLVSPSDLGELIEPFVFLDLAAFDGRLAPTPMGFGWHPHSGIAPVSRSTFFDGVANRLPDGAVALGRREDGVRLRVKRRRREGRTA